MWYERSWRWAKEHLTVTVPGAVLIFAATFIVMLAVNAGEVGAAWVQAVGSVVAILVAVWVSHREVKLQADGRLLDSYNYMHKTLSVAGYGAQAVENAADYLLSASFTAHVLQFHEHLLETAVQDLEEIQYTSIDSIKVAATFLSIKRAAAHTKASVTLVRQAGVNFTVPQLNGWKTTVNNDLKDLERGLNEYLVANPRLVDLVP